jgi:lysozyme family protein
VTPRFRAAFRIVVAHEGGFVDHASDPGGATNHGVSLRYARTKGRLLDLDQDGDVDADDIRRLTVEQAAELYHDDYWRPVRGDEVPAMVALVAFDAAINNGAGQAVRWLQRAAGVADDGRFGPRTLAAVQLAPPLQLAARLHLDRARMMTRLSTWPAFGRGWAVRLAELPFQAAQLAEAG